MRKDKSLTPGQLLEWVATQPTKKEACIECGAGLGELAGFFRSHFSRVIATDIAPLAQESPYGVTVTKAAAEHLPVDDESVDLLISMQALHHFDTERHLAEALRVLRPGGVFVALCWGEIVLPEPLRRVCKPTITALASHWETSRDWVLSGYAGLTFPGTPLHLPDARMTRMMTVVDIGAEISRWSASRKALTAGEVVPVPNWAGLDPIRPVPVHWPVLGRAFQV